MEISLCTLEPSKAQRVSDSHSNAKILLGRNAISNKQTRNPQVFWDLQHFIILRVFFFFLICTAYNVDILKRGALTTYIVVKSSCVDEIYLNSENLLLLANWLPLLQKLSKLFWRARVTSEPRFTLVIVFAFQVIISLPLNLRFYCLQAIESEIIRIWHAVLRYVSFWKHLSHPSLIRNEISGLKFWQNWWAFCFKMDAEIIMSLRWLWM